MSKILNRIHNFLMADAIPEGRKKRTLLRCSALLLSLSVAAGGCFTGYFFYRHEKNQNELLQNNKAKIAEFAGQTMRSSRQYQYTGQLNNEKRYLSLGFDDFRDSDFSLILPLIRSYQVGATFNRIAYDYDLRLNSDELTQISEIFDAGCEIGDHTWFHCNFFYDDPLFNGQEEEHPDGNQRPYPSNAQMREDVGNGRNVFGYALTASVGEQLCDWNNYDGEWTAFDTTWGNLTDEQCQIIRDHFSVIKNEPFISVLDELSNRYLGTNGASWGSWDEEQQCYTGGIFTGCQTSANHEIWERILDVTQRFYEEQTGTNFHFSTWSWPGTIPSPFRFERDGKVFFDEECTRLFNYLARFPSSLRHNSDGTNLERSWAEVLKEYGYRVAHDSRYPSRGDGLELPMMSRQLIYNAFLSREDALVYRTDSIVDYEIIGNKYGQDFFDPASTKSYAQQMYEEGGEFYRFLENMRTNTSNGMIEGEVIDSVESFSEEVFLRALLDYCQQTGVEVINHAQAYDICFRHKLDTGNLLYNPMLRNTIEEFLPDAENLPSNPDGYSGDCFVSVDDDTTRTLNTVGETRYLHYGIPLGDLRFAVNAKGDGYITIYGIRNNSPVTLKEEDVENLGSMRIHSDSFEKYDLNFFVRNEPKTEYEQSCAGLGEKIMGIMIVYSPGLSVNRMELAKAY